MSRRLGMVVVVTATFVPAQNTWRVPGDAATVTAAIALAKNGDRILLTGLVYGVGADAGGITVNKSLTIESASAGTALFTMTRASPFAFRIANPAGGRICLRNIDISGDTSGYSDSAPHVCVDVQPGPTASGVIVLEKIRAVGFICNRNAACPGLVIEGSPTLTLMIRNCSFTGATGDPPWLTTDESGFHGSPGAVIRNDGPLVVEETHFVGGKGASPSWRLSRPAAGDGAPGLICSAPRMAVSGGSITDGNGGDVDVTGYMYPNPQPCLAVGKTAASTPPARSFDVTYQAGRPGMAVGCPQTLPSPVIWGLEQRDLRVLTPQPRVGTLIEVEAASRGIGVGTTWLVIGPSLQHLTLGGFQGALFAGPPWLLAVVSARTSKAWIRMPLGTVPAVAADYDFALQLFHFDPLAWFPAFGSPATLTMSPVAQ